MDKRTSGTSRRKRQRTKGTPSSIEKLRAALLKQLAKGGSREPHSQSNSSQGSGRSVNLKKKHLQDECIVNLVRLLERKSGDWKDGVCVSDSGAVGVVEEFGKFEHLNLSLNLIGDYGATQLASYLLSPHCELKNLNLSQNFIGDEGCTALATATRKGIDDYSRKSSNPRSPLLKEMNLSSNKIGDLGAASIAKSLTSSETIFHRMRRLNLRGNNINDVGAFAFADSISRGSCSHLTSLHLGNNDIQKTGCKALASALLHATGVGGDLKRGSSSNPRSRGAACGIQELRLAGNPGLTLGVKQDLLLHAVGCRMVLSSEGFCANSLSSSH